MQRHGGLLDGDGGGEGGEGEEEGGESELHLDGFVWGKILCVRRVNLLRIEGPTGRLKENVLYWLGIDDG